MAVVLTRAAQNLYAPLRTVEPMAGIGRVNLRRNLALDTLLPTLPVRAQALAAWRLEDQWVTAVKLTNTSGRWLDLDPRALQGDFLAATFQHPTLGRPAAQPTPPWSISSPVARPGRVAAAQGGADRRDGEPAAAAAAGQAEGGARHEK